MIERVGQLPGFRVPASDDIQAVVHREPIQPRTERCFPLEASKLSIGLKEDLLEEVFAVFGGSGEAAGERVDSRRVLTVQGPKRLGVARLAARYDLRIAHRRVFRRNNGPSALPGSYCPLAFIRRRPQRRGRDLRGRPFHLTRPRSSTREWDTLRPSAIRSDRLSTSLPP
jgi:hypothetical protein